MVKPMRENSRRETTFNSTIKKIFHLSERFLNKVRSLSLIHIYCDKIAAKAIAAAAERIRALEQLGFKYTDEKLIGHDGTKYDSYFVLNRNE